MNMNPTSPTQTGSLLLAAASLTSVLLLAACASPPPPTASLKLAQQAIATAEQNEAGRYAPGELAESRTELAAANTAVSDKQMVTAKQLAEESTAAAEFASAKTADAKANAVNDEMKRRTAGNRPAVGRVPGVHGGSQSRDGPRRARDEVCGRSACRTDRAA